MATLGPLELLARGLGGTGVSVDVQTLLASNSIGVVGIGHLVLTLLFLFLPIPVDSSVGSWGLLHGVSCSVTPSKGLKGLFCLVDNQVFLPLTLTLLCACPILTPLCPTISCGVYLVLRNGAFITLPILGSIAAIILPASPLC